MPGPLLLIFAHPDDESSSAAGTDRIKEIKTTLQSYGLNVTLG